MNRVYKVIWSKAKHCYVVTSEIARSVTKSASSARSAGRKGAAVLAMAALLFTAGGVLGEAANVTDIEYGKTADVIMVTKDDGTTTPITINDVYHAMKANSDGDGLVIKENYAKKTDAKDNLKVGDDGVISKVTGKDGTTSSPVNKLVLNKDGDNQITMDEKGIKVGKNSTVIASDGVFAGGDTATDAKAALNANGSIKGADGKFTVDGATGNVEADGTLKAADGKFAVNADGKVTAQGGVNTAGAEINTAGGKITAGAITGTELNTQGGAITGGMATVTGLTTQGGDISGGDITATGLNTKGGEINGGDIKSSGTIHADGKITGNGLDAGSGAINGGSLSVTGAMEGNSLTLKGGKLDAGSGTITTTGNINGNNINATGTITTNNLAVTGGLEMNHITLGSETNNYTDINKGNVTSKVHEIDSDTVEYTAVSIFNKDGSSITASADEGPDVDSTGKSIVGAKEINQYLGDNAKPDGSQKKVTRNMVRNDDGTFSMEDKAVDGTKSSTVSQNAKEGIVSETNGGAGSKVTLTQGMNGTYKVETSGTSTEEISGQKIENYKGGLDTNITGNETHDVSGNMTTTVTGDSSLTAENITNEAKNKITNKAIDVETDATSSIVQKVTNAAGSNTSTQWSYQTLEEMSQADGKTASYLRGAADEKSQLTDGDKKTTIDTVAGQTNTNITDGTNTSNDLQKADQIASSVTDGTNKTVVNQNAGSLASSITAGTKFNNTNNTVDKSEQQIRASDTQFSATSKTATKMEDALVSGGSVIDVMKNLDDAANPFIGSAVTDGTNNITVVTQTAKDITNTAEKGTIANNAKDITNNATENMTNTVGKDLTTTVGGNETRTVKGTLTETVTGNVTEDYKADLSTKVGGNETHAVTGNQTVTVSKDRTVNVKGTETENFNAQVTSVKTDQKTSVGGNQTNIVTGDQQNTVSGSKTETVKKAVTEKYGSQATTVDGDQSTNVGRNQSNVVKGNQTNTISGSKTESVKGAVSETYGSQSTTVNGNQSNTVKGTLTETVTGNVTEDYKANLDTTVGGNETRTVEGTLTETVTGDVTEDYKANLDTNVTGDSSLKAKNIHNTANEALTNDANTITNKAHKSVTTQIGNGTTVKSVMDVNGIANTASTGTITNYAVTITNTGIASVTNQVNDNKVLVETNQVKSAFGNTIYTTWDADGITNNAADKAVKTITGNNTVISDNDGTTFENTAHSTAFKGGTVTKTTISGNTITTGKAVMDYANVTKDLSVGGDLNVKGNIETHDAELSENSRQVVTGRQLYQTNERVDRLDNRIKKVGANAAALAALRPGDFNPDDKFSIAAGFGSYRNANAAALGLFYRPNENVLLSLGTSFGDGENMVNAGVSVKFGRGKSMAERRKEMADEVSSMRDEMRSQDERIAELEEMLKKQSELIEKLSKES